MKATGIVRKVDDLGRLCLPKELRKISGIKEGDSLEIYTENGFIILKKYIIKESCAICGSEEDTVEIASGRYLCRECIGQAIEKI